MYCGFQKCVWQFKKCLALFNRPSISVSCLQKSTDLSRTWNSEEKIRIWIMKCIPHSVVKMSYNLCLYILPKVKHHILLISSHWGKHITFSNFYIFFPHFCITQLVKRCGRKMWSLYVPIFIWPFTEYYFCWLFKHLILFDVLMSLRPWPNCFIALLLYRLCEKHTAH